MVFGVLLSVARSGEVFLKKVGLEQTLKDWLDLDVNMEDIIGKENVMIDTGMRKQVYRP